MNRYDLETEIYNLVYDGNDAHTNRWIYLLVRPIRSIDVFITRNKLLVLLFERGI